jgi:hypothetical protein
VNNLIYYIRRILLVILLGVLILSMPSCRYIKQRLSLGEYSLKAAVKWAKQDSIRVADSLKKLMPENNVLKQAMTDSMERVMSNKRVFEKTLTDSLLSVEEKKPPERNKVLKFYIITGSFTNQVNAEKGARKYSVLGYETTIINATNRDGTKMKLVSVKIFNDYNQAKSFLKSFQKQANPDAWIFKGTLK